MNLEQAQGVFVVGIACIAAGLVVVGATLAVVYVVRADSNSFTQGAVAVVGAIGAILTNYVAYMYFKMNTPINDSLMTFHKQLAAIHDLYFANVLVQSVDLPEKKAETLLRLASAVAERNAGTALLSRSGDAPSPASVQPPPKKENVNVSLS